MNYKKSKRVKKEQKEDVVTVTCSRVINGVTWTTSAGNWFSGTSGASSRCEAKLDRIANSFN